MKTLTLKIDGVEVSVSEGGTILDAAVQAGIRIPTLCHVKGLCAEGACRVCVVELGNVSLAAACSTAAREGMDIKTNSPLAAASRRMSLELLCRYHRMDCDNCPRYTDCEFHDVLTRAGINSDDYETFQIPPEEETPSACIVRDHSKCVLCRRCEAACAAQGLNLLSAYDRGPLTRVGSVLPLSESGCVDCGQCLALCPTGALHEVNETAGVWRLLGERGGETAALVTPETEAMIREVFHTERGAEDAPKLVSLLRRIGFRHVYSTAPAEEYRDALLSQEAGNGAVIDAACPAAAKLLRTRHPAAAARLAETPSAAALTARRIREENPSCHIVYVSSCVAAKAVKEAWGVDAALTVPELRAVIHRACVSRATALEVWSRIRGESYDALDFPETPGTAEGVPVRTLSGLAAAAELPEPGTAERGVFRLLACPGGCLNGGGQLRQSSAQLSDGSILERRRQTL